MVNSDIVVLTDGYAAIFGAHPGEAPRIIQTRLKAHHVRYNDCTIEVIGTDTYDRSSSRHSFLILVGRGREIEGKILTERDPTPAEQKEIDAAGRWRKPRLIAKYTRCAVPVREGWIPPAGHPEHFSLERIASTFPSGPGYGLNYIFSDSCDKAKLPDAVYGTRGLNSDRSLDIGSFLFGIERKQSRLVVDSRELRHHFSFLVAPGTTHIAVFPGGRQLVLAGRRKAYVYG